MVKLEQAGYALVFSTQRARPMRCHHYDEKYWDPPLWAVCSIQEFDVEQVKSIKG